MRTITIDNERNDDWMKSLPGYKTELEIHKKLSKKSKKTKLRVVTKGGPGSGHFGHAGRTGEVGGSVPGKGISLTPSEGYAEDLVKRLRDRERERKKVHWNLNSNADSAMYHLGFRGGPAEDYAMAEYVEKAVGGDMEIMLEVLGSQEAWAMAPSAAKHEWAAAQALGGNKQLPLKDMELPTLSDKHIAGYKARKDFVEAYVRENYGEEIVVYRGVRGRMVSKLTDQLYGYNRKGVYHEPTMKVEDMRIAVRALASYTTQAWAADTFAKGKTGLVIKKTIKPSDVWMMTKLGVRSPIRFMEDGEEFVTFNVEDDTTASIDHWGY